MSRRVLIIGHGVVGRNMAKIFPDADIHDPAQGRTATGMHDVAFVCVPTDMLPDGRCDTSIVEEVVREHLGHVDVFCIKSTVPPGTTDRIAEEMSAHCVFSPEYYGGTPSANGVDYDFVILGGAPRSRAAVAEVYKERMTGAFHIMQTDAKTAELCKYMENSFLALKVTFCNEFYRLSRALGVDYNELREAWLLDPRIGRSHTFVYEDHPFYDSHCLNKDVPAIIEVAREAGAFPYLLDMVRSLNGQWRARAALDRVHGTPC